MHGGNAIRLFFIGFPKASVRQSTGGFNNDKIVDRNDVVAFKPYLRQPATACPECDLDGDGTITILDARRLALLAK